MSVERLTATLESGYTWATRVILPTILTSCPQERMSIPISQ
jgi:hypothetical protein